MRAIPLITARPPMLCVATAAAIVSGAPDELGRDVDGTPAGGAGTASAAAGSPSATTSAPT